MYMKCSWVVAFVVIIYVVSSCKPRQSGSTSASVGGNQFATLCEHVAVSQFVSRLPNEQANLPLGYNSSHKTYSYLKKLGISIRDKHAYGYRFGLEGEHKITRLAASELAAVMATEDNQVLVAHRDRKQLITLPYSVANISPSEDGSYFALLSVDAKQTYLLDVDPERVTQRYTRYRDDFFHWVHNEKGSSGEGEAYLPYNQLEARNQKYHNEFAELFESTLVIPQNPTERKVDAEQFVAHLFVSEVNLKYLSDKKLEFITATNNGHLITNSKNDLHIFQIYLPTIAQFDRKTVVWFKQVLWDKKYWREPKFTNHKLKYLESSSFRGDFIDLLNQRSSLQSFVINSLKFSEGDDRLYVGGQQCLDTKACSPEIYGIKLVKTNSVSDPYLPVKEDRFSYKIDSKNVTTVRANLVGGLDLTKGLAAISFTDRSRAQVFALSGEKSEIAFIARTNPAVVDSPYKARPYIQRLTIRGQITDVRLTGKESQLKALISTSTGRFIWHLDKVMRPFEVTRHTSQPPNQASQQQSMANELINGPGVYALATNYECDSLISGGSGGDIKITDLNSRYFGKSLSQFSAHKDRIISIDYPADRFNCNESFQGTGAPISQYFLSAATSGEVKIWEIQRPGPPKLYQTVQSADPNPKPGRNSLNHAALSSDLKAALIAPGQGPLKALAIEAPSGNNNPASTRASVPNETNPWQMMHPDLLAHFKKSPETKILTVRPVAYDKDKKHPPLEKLPSMYAYITTQSPIIWFSEYQSGAIGHGFDFNFAQEFFTDFTFTSNGAFVLAGTNIGHFYVRSVTFASGKSYESPATEKDVNRSTQPVHQGPITGIGYMSGLERFITVGLDGRIMQWSMWNKNCPKKKQDPHYSKSTCDQERVIKPQLAHAAKLPNTSFTALTMSSDDNFAVLGTADGRVMLQWVNTKLDASNL